MGAGSERSRTAGELLRTHGVGVGGALVIAALGFGAVRWISTRTPATMARKQHQFSVVKIVPDRAVKPPPPPPRVEPQKPIEQPRTTRVELKPSDMVAPPSSASPAPAPGGGRLSLAAEGQGAGDAFNLVGNPGGRGLLSGGGLGDGSGDATGDLGGGGPGARFGRYYAKVAVELEEAFRRAQQLSKLSARLELRVWIDSDGRIRRIAPVHEDVDPKVREALQSVVGLRITEPPPADIPMPMVARLTARRPQ